MSVGKKLTHATMHIWRSAVDFGESVLPFHHGVIGIEVRLSDLMTKVTLSTKPFSLILSKPVL